MTAAKGFGRVTPPLERNAVSGAARREKVYLWVIVAAWVFVPELRRIVDWLSGAGSLAVINLIPMVLMLPVFWLALKKRKYGLEMNIVLMAWGIAFSYGLFVALASGGLFGAFYDLATFCVPLLAGLWVINASLNRRELFATLTTASLSFGTIVSLYGLYQFAAPPAWDVLWVHNSGLISVGTPEPFQLRIFSTLNSPATLGAFLVFTILSSLHRVTAKRIWLLIPLVLCTLALGLSLVRAAYLALALGVVVYSICSTQRRQLIALGSVLAALVVIAALSLPILFGGQTAGTDRLTSRVSSFNNLQRDPSAVSREEQTATALHEAVSEPLGQGLGTVGTSARLTNASGETAVLDNGYISRWLELGIVGFPAYLFAVISALFFTVRRWLRARQSRGAHEDELNLMATAIAVQVALIGTEIAGDAHNELGGVYFWFMVGLALKGAAMAVTAPVQSTLRARLVSWAPSGKIA